MAEGTGVGNIFLDLIVRDTTKEQINKIAAKGQETAQKAFSGVEKVAEKATARMGSAAQKATQTAAQAAQRVSATMAQSVNRSVAVAEANVRKLEREYERISDRLNDVTWSYSFNENGDRATDRLAEKLNAQREAAYDRLLAARERLRIYSQIAAQKQADAESAAAQKAVVAEEKAASRRKAIHAKMWKNMLAKAGAGVKSMVGKLAGIAKGFHHSGNTAGRFRSRLREIASGALIFNGISAALRGMVSHFGTAIASTDGMKQALANLRGAAANAASPLIQVLTPALTALANAAATVFSYVSKLLTLLTGKISNAAATAKKSSGAAANAAKKAAKSLASFDEIERLGEKPDDSSGGGGGTVEPNYKFEGKSPFLDDVLSAIEGGRWEQVGTLFAKKINDSLGAINWEKIQRKAVAWTENLTKVFNGFVRKLDFGLIGSTIGNGLNTVGLIIDTFFQKTDWIALGKGFSTGLNGLFDTVDWSLMGRVLTDKLKALTEIFHGFVQTFDFKKLGTDLAEMVTAGIGNIDWVQLTVDLVAGIEGLWNLCSGFIQGIDWAKLGSNLWDSLIGIVTGIDWPGLVSSAFECLGSVLGGSAALFEGLCNAVFESLKTAWNNTVDYFNTFIDEASGNIIEGLWNGIIAAFSNAGQWIRDHIFKPFINGFKTAFGIHSPSTVMAELGVNLIQGLLDGMLSLLRSIGSWLKENLIDPIINTVKNALGIHSPSTVFEGIGVNLVEGLLNGLKNTWSTVTSFVDQALQGIKTAFTDAFRGLQKTVTGIWTDGIVPAIKKAINGIIGAINGMISGVANGINTIARSLNKLSFTVPEWLKDVPIASKFAGKTFGFNIGTVSAPKIPYLASGGVIKQPTLAMMGEYPGAGSNPEIVTPQSLMAETVSAAMSDLVAANVAGFEAVVAILREILETILGIEIGDEIIGQAVERYKRKMAVVEGGT